MCATPAVTMLPRASTCLTTRARESTWCTGRTCAARVAAASALGPSSTATLSTAAPTLTRRTCRSPTCNTTTDRPSLSAPRPTTTTASSRAGTGYSCLWMCGRLIRPPRRRWSRYPVTLGDSRQPSSLGEPTRTLTSGGRIRLSGVWTLDREVATKAPGTGGGERLLKVRLLSWERRSALRRKVRTLGEEAAFELLRMQL